MKVTPLNGEHKRLNAKMTDFHGWEMPLQYTSIIEEHMAVRTHAGIFDVSHMGDIVVEGSDALRFMDYILPTKVSSMKDGEAAYSAFLSERGTMIDDTIVYRMNEEKVFFVPNAATTEKIRNHLTQTSYKFNVNIYNFSENVFCIALQGPESEHVLKEISLPPQVKPFTFSSVPPFDGT